MSDEYQPTQEELIINRLAQRLGLVSAQNEILQLQLEQAQRELAVLRENTPVDADPSTNGEHQEVVVA